MSHTRCVYLPRARRQVGDDRHRIEGTKVLQEINGVLVETLLELTRSHPSRPSSRGGQTFYDEASLAIGFIPGVSTDPGYG
jgi:hypothetical protein